MGSCPETYIDPNYLYMLTTLTPLFCAYCMTCSLSHSPCADLCKKETACSLCNHGHSTFRSDSFKCSAIFYKELQDVAFQRVEMKEVQLLMIIKILPQML